MYLKNAQCLRMVRTEEAKRLRKDYEAHRIKHGFNEFRVAEPRKDGICNTVSTVLKDNLIIEEWESDMEIERVGQISNDGSQYGTVISEDGLSATLAAGTHGYANNCIATEEVEQYRIRKLTPREVFRLMNFSDKQFDSASEVSSNTALYKAAGNSIVVNCITAIVGQMIDGRQDYYKRIVDNPVGTVDND